MSSSAAIFSGDLSSNDNLLLRRSPPATSPTAMISSGGILLRRIHDRCCEMATTTTKTAGARVSEEGVVETFHNDDDEALDAAENGVAFLVYKKALQSTGVDPQPVITAAKWSSNRTFKKISTQNYFMVDIRSEKDKDKASVPHLLSSVKNRMISIPLEELPSELRGLVRNVKKVEAELAALKISYLKKINKGSNIVIMDSYSDSAKIVARTLTSLGFKNTWIVADGFSRNKRWLQSRLGTDSYFSSFAEVLSPSRVIPAAVRGFGTTSQSSAKLLPGAD
ncbi:calcium sensing receptor, chloroplastic-like [Arachis stenosperma]|uniref:calcium sensing receptor, chloroplastic-like n=1 Tax=Arachis stenosperma TaxID=217475 RepID=UPI0025AD3B2A|nr:calcium sensing receptor, chloroplastic-like [Arachis stenosperma]